MTLDENAIRGMLGYLIGQKGGQELLGEGSEEENDFSITAISSIRPSSASASYLSRRQT
jgi:hypothetical protein